jgi:ABC-type antimicrobial peptide transport system permease subunit
MALGARRDDILRMFLRKGVALAGVGIVAGLVFFCSHCVDDGKFALWGAPP